MSRLLEEMNRAFDVLEDTLKENGYDVSKFSVDMQEEDSLRNAFESFLDHKVFYSGIDHVFRMQTVIQTREKAKDLIKAEFLVYYREELRIFNLIQLSIMLIANNGQFNKVLTTPLICLPSSKDAIKMVKLQRKSQEKQYNL